MAERIGIFFAFCWRCKSVCDVRGCRRRSTDQSAHISRASNAYENLRRKGGRKAKNRKKWRYFHARHCSFACRESIFVKWSFFFSCHCQNGKRNNRLELIGTSRVQLKFIFVYSGRRIENNFCSKLLRVSPTFRGIFVISEICLFGKQWSLDEWRHWVVWFCATVTNLVFSERFQHLRTEWTLKLFFFLSEV